MRCNRKETMTKRKNIFIFIFMMPIFFGCSSSGGSNNSDLASFGNEEDVSLNTSSPSPTFDECQVKELIVGNWYDYGATDSSDNSSFRNNYFTFKSDGSFRGIFEKYQTYDTYELTGTYEVQSNQLLSLSYDAQITYSDDQSIFTDHIEKIITMDLSWNNLTLNFSDDLEYSLTKVAAVAMDDLELTEVDGICEDQYIKICPANDIIGKWDVATFYNDQTSSLGEYLLPYPIKLTDDFGMDNISVRSNGYLEFAGDAADISSSNYYNIYFTTCNEADCQSGEWIMLLSPSEITDEDEMERVRFTISDDILVLETVEEDLTTIVLHKTEDYTAADSLSCE